MTLDEAIEVLRHHNVKGASVSRITGGQALEKDLLAQVLDSCEQLISEKAEYKRLLKAAVEDIHKIDQCCVICKNKQTCTINCAFVWQHEAEALKLIGGSENG